MALNHSTDKKLRRLHLSESLLPIDSYRDISDQILSGLNKYPDPECTELKESISRTHSVNTKQIFIGNGSDEVIRLIASARKRTDIRCKAIISEKTFPGHILATSLSGYKINTIPLSSYKEDCEEICRNIDNSTSLIFLCNPHNPCGTVNSATNLINVLKEANKKDVWVAIDEAYIDFAEPDYSSIISEIERFRNLIVIRTLSKSHALAGIRVGYAISSSYITKNLEEEASSMPFNVNMIAQIVAKYSLDRPEYKNEIIARSKVLVSQAHLALEAANIDYIKSHTNFVFFRPKDISLFHDTISDSLAVRDCAAFGHKGWIRCSFACSKDVSCFTKLVEHYSSELRRRHIKIV